MATLEPSALDADSARALAALVDQGILAIATVREGIVVSASRPFLTLFGLPGAGARIDELASAADSERAVGEIALVTAAGKPARIAFQARRADGSLFDVELLGAPLSLPEGPALAVVATDVTVQSRAHERLSYLAYLDPLTGLPNRSLLIDRLRQLLTESQHRPRSFAVFLADLDGFKQVNDQFGHEAGDSCLQTAAQRLAGCVRESDTVARLGGDEFAVLLSRLAKQDDAALVAGRMVRTTAEPMLVAGHSVRLGVSIGIATYPGDSADLDGLLARADVAMYESKRAGKGRFSFAERGTAPHVVPVPFLVWRSGYELSWPTMDQDHRDLVVRINRLGDQLKAGRDRGALLSTLGDLVDHTEKHFASEERLLDAVPDLPSATEHREAHRRLLDDVRSLTVAVDASSMSLTMRFLQEWLLRHIRSLDLDLAQALRERTTTHR